jgi:hypothetical protein
MTPRNIAFLFILTLLLAACGGTLSTETPTEVPAVVTERPVIATPTLNVPTPYPEPALVTSVPNQSAYPAPGTPGTGTVVIPTSGYEPQPGDQYLTRGQVFLDMANSRFSTSAIPTTHVGVVLQGNLPDPCHSLRVVVSPPDENNVINLEAYSLVDPGKACITVLKPFTAEIPLGNYPDGDYTVMVNGERLGEFSNGSGVAPAVQVTP